MDKEGWALPARLMPRVRRAVMRLRIRVARAILLPQLSSQEAYELRHKVMDESVASRGYILMCALSAGIATLGLLQSSVAVVIGAMLISPLMAPIAALGFGFASIDGQRIRDAARVVLIGAAMGILIGVLLTLLSPIRNATPEILARTQPTLLDLAVALLSGLAGGYATVMGKGGTAIGVAIATALMPPLATVGYGIGVMQPMFALGALLLFLTNLSAIAFAFAAVARLSGAARPIRNVEWSPRYVIAGSLAFLALATPLALTLMQLTREARLRTDARAAITSVLGEAGTRIAQMDINWSLLGAPQISAVVVTNRYAPTAEADVRQRLLKSTDEDLGVMLQQVVAADLQGQTRAMIDAAMERTAAGIAADVPPFSRIRAGIGLPTKGIWTNRAERVIYIEPVAAPGWALRDYYGIEQQARAVADGWQVRLLPPVQDRLDVALAPDPADTAAIPVDLAIWALQRWGLNAPATRVAAGDDIEPLRKAFGTEGIQLRSQVDEGQAPGTVSIEILPPPPGAAPE